LDASVAIAWCFDEASSPLADRLLSSLPTVDAVVPSLWRLEVGNVLLTAERQKRSSPTDTETWLRMLRRLSVRIDDSETEGTWLDAIRLARANSLSLYDACYLELSLRRGAKLATLDNKLVKAAEATGVGLFFG
jgi:predicted nucleic acid-binding protein